MKLFGIPYNFMFSGKLRVDFFSTSELLFPFRNIKLRLIRARPYFDMISDNPDFSLGIVECSIYTRRVALKDDYHMKRMYMFEYTPAKFSYLESLEKIPIIPARQNQKKWFIKKKTFLTMLQLVGLLLQ